MRILGLDPGSRYTGYGLIDRRGSQLKKVAQGRIVLSPASPLPARLARLCAELGGLLRRFEPEAAVLESLFRGVNVRSLIVLAQARGALLATLAAGGVDIHEYSPAEIKTAVVGHGRADKAQVSRMVTLILGLGEERLTPDASDALAVAICFAQRLRLDRLGAPSAAHGQSLSSCK
ncbi:MAG: crossover junction endodeoxyribonuclease RuvC [bacterium]|nr:crossover junction endodeoxyribonuclease RuvC [bacterium]